MNKGDALLLIALTFVIGVMFGVTVSAEQPAPTDIRAWTAIDTRTGDCLACGSERGMDVLWHKPYVKIVWNATEKAEVRK